MKLDSYGAIITGGASGMGEATARLLAQNGLKVAILDRDFTKAKTIADEIQGVAFKCDVTNDSEVETAIAGAIAALGSIRVCINCAGIAPAQRIVGREGPMPIAAFRDVININLIGSFNVMRLIASHMTKLELMGEERGLIIHTASIAAYEGQIGQAAYSASKAGLVGMILPAARELAQFSIRVNAIAPGLIATPLLLDMPEKVQNQLIEAVPFPKRFGYPSEYALLVKHMIENPMLNGCVIRMDAALRMSA